MSSACNVTSPSGVKASTRLAEHSRLKATGRSPRFWWQVLCYRSCAAEKPHWRCFGRVLQKHLALAARLRLTPLLLRLPLRAPDKNTDAYYTFCYSGYCSCTRCGRWRRCCCRCWRRCCTSAPRRSPSARKPPRPPRPLVRTSCRHLSRPVAVAWPTSGSNREIVPGLQIQDGLGRWVVSC